MGGSYGLDEVGEAVRTRTRSNVQRVGAGARTGKSGARNPGGNDRQTLKGSSFVDEGGCATVNLQRRSKWVWDTKEVTTSCMGADLGRKGFGLMKGEGRRFRKHKRGTDSRGRSEVRGARYAVRCGRMRQNPTGRRWWWWTVCLGGWRAGEPEG